MKVKCYKVNSIDYRKKEAYIEELYLDSNDKNIEDLNKKYTDLQTYAAVNNYEIINLTQKEKEDPNYSVLLEVYDERIAEEQGIRK